MEGYTVAYCDHTSILIVNTLGRIRQLYTPFRVICREDYLNLQKGTSIYVDEVATNLQDELLYVTSLGIYDHSYFTIVASF
jgi:purine nucleoside phosphorylase